MNYVKEQNENFYIAESDQKNGGKGLFAICDLDKGYELEIVGVVAESRECVRYADSHNFITQDGKCLVSLGFGGLVNHATNPAHQNVEYDSEKLVYRAMRKIKKDEEILAFYGAAFANILAVYQTLNIDEDFITWQQQCEDIADSKEGMEIYEKVFESVFATS